MRDNKRKCASCASSNIERIARTISFFHVIFKCRDCNKYTDFFINRKHRILSYTFMCLSMVLIIIPPTVMCESCPKLSAGYFIAAIIIYFYLGNKIWWLRETTPHEHIPKKLSWLYYRGKKRIYPLNQTTKNMLSAKKFNSKE